ncbi:MAG: ankyrin repeat domain-containing protein, partial [Bdellovibrionota bacterium]
SLILSPRIGAFFSSTQTAPGIVGVIFIAIFVLGLCVGFAYLIDHISDTLDLVRSFPEYFRFFVLVLVLMLLPAFALNSFPKVAAILFVAVAFKSFQQFRDTFRPDELKLRAIFIAFFGTLFLFFYVISFAVTRRPAPPPVLLSSVNSPQAPPQILPAQPPQPVREPADEADSAKRKLKEIDTDLDNVDLLVPREVSRPVTPPPRNPQQTHLRNPATDLFAVAQLFSAAKSGNLPVVREMIEKRRVSPNQHTESSVTPLMVAAYGGQTEVVRYLISKGAKINGQNQAGTTPLIFAVYGNHKDTVYVLIKSGANYRLRTHKGDTALDIAKRIKNNDIVQLLGGKWVGAKSNRKTAAIAPKNRSSLPRQRKADSKRAPTGKGVKLVKPIKKKKSKKVSASP